MKGRKRASERVGRSICAWEVALETCFLPKDISPAESALQRTDRSSQGAAWHSLTKTRKLSLVRYLGTVNLTSGPQVSQTEGEEKQTSFLPHSRHYCTLTHSSSQLCRESKASGGSWELRRKYARGEGRAQCSRQRGKQVPRLRDMEQLSHKMKRH